jgi:hypothetical protein
MANLRKYEIDAVVEEIQIELKKTSPKFNEKSVTLTKEFQEIVKIEKQINKLEETIKDLETKRENLVINHKEFDKNKYFNKADSNLLLSRIKSNFEAKYNIDSNKIERQVILSSSKDLGDIVKEVIKKLSK